MAARERDVVRCEGCGKWCLHDPLCEDCAEVYARMAA